MNLLSIRQQFCKLSGRYDLATESAVEFDTDNGADFFINAGMRFLDKRYQTHKTVASYFDDVASGAWYLTFQNCIAITEVWCNDDDSRWKLLKYSYKSIKEEYSGTVSESDGGPPAFYCPIWLRSVEATDFQNIGTFFNYVKTDDDGTYNGIMFAPKTDGAYNIEVVGKFYHTDLSDNTDENYWTNVVPEVLLKAALWQLEVFYRNTEGAKDWMAALELEGSELEKNLVDQESSDMEVME